MCNWPSLLFSCFLIFLFSDRFGFRSSVLFVVLLFFFSFFPFSYCFFFFFFISFCCGWCRFLDFFIPPNRTASAGRRCTKSRIESITSSISVHHPITFRRVDVISLRVGLYITNGEERKSRREREREKTRPVYDGRPTHPVQSISNNTFALLFLS